MISKATALTLGSVLLFPAPAAAQAWLPADGETAVSVFYHHLFVHDHVFSRGERQDVGHIRSHIVTTDIEYGLSDRIAVRAALPFVAARYDGNFPHRHPPDPAPVDDENYNVGFQDFRLEARYALREFPVAIAPFAALIVPSHGYEFFGHSAIGLNLHELQLGTFAGLLIGSAYIQGRYAYGINERIIGRRRNRSTIDFEFGWTARPGLRLFAFENGQVSHGGIDLPWPFSPALLSPDEWHNHDRVVRANSLSLGGGASFQLSDSVALAGSLWTTVAGRNMHATQYGVTVGTTWNLGGGPLHHGPPVTRR